MKKLLLVLFTLMSSLNAVAGIGGYEHTFNEDKQEDKYEWAGFDDVPSNYDNHIRLGKMFNIRYNPNKSSMTDFTLYIKFSNVVADKSYMACGKPIWTLDNVPYLNVEQRAYNDADGSSAITLLTRQDFAKFANASKIEYNFCGRDYTFDKYEIEGIQRVYSDFAKDHL